MKSVLFSGKCVEVVMFSLVESLQTLSQSGFGPPFVSSLSLTGP